MPKAAAGVLTVSTSQDFAAKWLVHRLARFAAANPGIDLRVSATIHNVDFAREDVDVAVRHGDAIGRVSTRRGCARSRSSQSAARSCLRGAIA